jgi:hypothetical protein
MPSGVYERSKEVREKFSKLRLGKEPWNKGTKGLMPIPWNKGKEYEKMKGNKHAKGNKPNRTSFVKGQRISPETEFKKGEMSDKQKGENNSNWKGGYSKLKKLEAIAGRPKPNYCEVCGEKGQICFDHNHLTGKFRGWICSSCNFALGHSKDRPELLIKLANYLIETNVI